MAKYKRNTMTAYRTIPQLERCDRRMFGDLILTCQTPIQGALPEQVIQPIPYTMALRRASVDSISGAKTSIMETEKRRASALVDELLIDIYYSVHNSTTDYNSTSGKSHRSSWMEFVSLQDKDIEELRSILSCLHNYIERMGSVLVRQLKRRDALCRQQEAYCDVITKRLGQRLPEVNPTKDMRFTIQPLPGDTGFSQWTAAMKMVAQLPGGIPTEFRRRLWLTLAERHLASNGISWPEVERTCFSEWSHPADAELGVQIVKDLHRTGCSLFCGKEGQENQALLKRVLLAYARWNKAVGYCQGFNMLAALILQVTEKCEGDALKLMIFLIEGVLPDSYFADSLRGLSVDMAVFRELLRSRLPELSKHLDLLQNAAKDGTRSYEPPLTNVFTMQWFLTLFCNCLPQPTVLRVWDLILLEGNEILLRTSLAIWQVLAGRILGVRSADEFYCVMGVLMRELLEFDLIEGNALIKAMVAIGPLKELKTLRDHYLYNINPWGPSLPQMVDKQLKLYSKQSIALDISALKKQYGKLKQRQQQAHIIFSAAISRQPPPTPPVTMNHLLIGKSALVPAKRLGPPKGSIPPARQAPSTLHWKDTPKQTSSSSSSDTELCDEESASLDEEDNLPLDSDTNLMRNDNTCASREIEDIPTSPCLNPPTETPKPNGNSIISKSESDDENCEFEQFLADRVKCLKVTEDEQEDRVHFARRNSVRALQIIQENSMILHRILQCQSRLSPSPPLIYSRDAIGADNVSDVSGCFSSISISDETEIDMTFDSHESHKGSDKEDNGIDRGTLKSSEYGSKYSSILEKSKSLDEKYNSLILKKPVSKTTEELNSYLRREFSDIVYSRQNRLESTSSTETLGSLATYDIPSYSASKIDGNLSILVEEAVSFETNTDRETKESEGKLLNSADFFDSEDKKPYITENEASNLKNREDILLERSFLSSYLINCQTQENEPSHVPDFIIPGSKTPKLIISDEEIEDSHESSNEGSEESKSQDSVGFDNCKTSAEFPQNKFTELISTAVSDVTLADFDNIWSPMHTRQVEPDTKNALHLLLGDDFSVSKEFEYDIMKCKTEIDYESLVSLPCRDHTCIPQISNDKSDHRNTDARAESNSPYESESKMESVLEYKKTCEDRCNSEEQMFDSEMPQTVNICSDRSSFKLRSPPFCNDVEREKCNVELTHDDDGCSKYSPSSSSRDHPSRSTSPFISDDWYSTERNNKNLGIEVVVVGGSSNLRSPSRPVSLSPLSSSPTSTLKSPSKSFNPFPVQLSSRQTKEVPIKLGLYKK